MRLKKHGRNRRQRLKALQAEQLAKEDIVSANVQPPHEPSHETYTNTPVVVVDSLTKTRATASQTADKQTQSALVSQRSFRKPATSASTPRPRARTKCKQRSESLSQNTPSLNNSTTSLNSSQSSLSTTLNPLDTSVAFDQTETDWFRLRALGIDPSRVRKRSFDSDEEEEKRNPDGDRLRGRSSNTPAARIALPPPTTTIDPLARWEAYKARSRTAASSPIEKIPTPVVQHGFNESFAPNPSPAPAYRNRVSRFVPRHLYGKGRDAVREYRASIRNSQGSQGSPSQTGAGLGPLDLSSPIQTHQSYSTNYANFSGNDGDQDPEYDDEQYVQGDEEYEYEEDDYYDEDDEGVGTNMAGGTQDDAIELSD
ncbi:uncharacterized protein BDR25DRAFT_301594 [Lindgomyces ingoldianus]|uniref:Uncharacterized protein n=1 Tax=Lindgomyces ingoldianus TaxID=673940 RepID=A0ACB6R717_9PLEO|nr:uncharacterized protein BDR25DRAFT_301594 [Lindgomyces ingoldianus]KAF2474112.1 hypothetical protein BDR25DRAFT_301594 [Lindgomyces ingoldianus]